MLLITFVLVCKIDDLMDGQINDGGMQLIEHMKWTDD